MQFKKLSRKDKDTYNQFKELYFKAFPEQERRPIFLFWLSSKLGKIDVFTLEKNEEFVGLLITAKNKDIVWVDYLAISSKFRGQGLGSESLERLKEYYSDSRIFLEVETPLDNVDNYHQRVKRISFYNQNGFNNSGLRVNCFDCDFTILSYNGNIKYQEYVNITKTTYGPLTYRLSKIKKIDDAFILSNQFN